MSRKKIFRERRVRKHRYAVRGSWFVGILDTRIIVSRTKVVRFELRGKGEHLRFFEASRVGKTRFRSTNGFSFSPMEVSRVRRLIVDYTNRTSVCRSTSTKGVLRRSRLSNSLVNVVKVLRLLPILRSSNVIRGDPEIRLEAPRAAARAIKIAL